MVRTTTATDPNSKADLARRALRDADDDTLRDTFGDLVDRMQGRDGTTRVDAYLSPKYAAYRDLPGAFGRFRFDGPPRHVAGGDVMGVTFHVHPDDDVRTIRNRVLQALSPTDEPRR